MMEKEPCSQRCTNCNSRVPHGWILPYCHACRVVKSPEDRAKEIVEAYEGSKSINGKPVRGWHPLELAYRAAIEQATSGKGERHGGDSIPFYRQQWVMLAEHHGPGFLTGQAAKKLNEAANGYDTSEITNEAYERELLGAIVYAGMAWLKLKGYPEP